MAESEAWRRSAGSRYWREEDARAVLEAWRRSGDTLSDFCRSYGVSVSRLSRWAARIKHHEAVQFYPVRLSDRARRSSDGVLAVELPDGITVRLESGFAVEDLKRVLEAVGSRTEC